MARVDGTLPPISDEMRELVARVGACAPRPTVGARARVWMAVEARRGRGRSHRWRWALVAAPVCAALFVAALFVQRRSDGPHALVLDSDGHERVVRAGERLPRLADLSLVDLAGAGRMVAGAGTFADLERLDGRGVQVALDRGSLLLHVLPRPADAPFVVRTPSFTARVIGTVLRVAVHADGSSSIAVGHGVVEVQTASGEKVRVAAGERWPRASRDVPLGAELERLGAVDLEGTTAASFAPPPEAPAKKPVPPSSTVGDESALYEAGFRALTEEHDARAALDIWQAERARFPHGVLARDVSASIIDALVALKQSDRALREIDGYLRDAPDSLRAPELHFVRATLYRELDGNCRRVRGELQRALERPAEPWARRARALRAACR